MSGITDLLLTPFTMLTGLIGRYPWQSVAVCTVLSVILLALHDAGSASGFLMVGSIILVWLDETRNPRAINEGVAAGD